MENNGVQSKTGPSGYKNVAKRNKLTYIKEEIEGGVHGEVCCLWWKQAYWNHNSEW